MSAVEERLRDRIRAAGPIPFAVFMEEALYGDGGYYRRDELPIGEDGDFVTAPSHSPLFGAATARLLARLDAALGRPAAYLEVGYGNGEHLAALSETLGSAPARRLLAVDRVARPLPRGFEAVGALDRIAPGSVDGLVFSFELFDALPVHRLIAGDDDLDELWVDVDAAGDFTFRQRELSDPALAGLVPAPLAPGQVADLAPGWRPLYRRLAERLGRGLVVTCDYGFSGPRLVDPRVRRHGTLACYRRQWVHRDPFAGVGEQDLTAHVDFPALIAEGEAAGLETLAFTRLAPWLAELGLLADLETRPASERVRAIQIMALDGMGEEIRVLVQGRGISRRLFTHLALA